MAAKKELDKFRNKPFSKDVISAPLPDFRHVGHIGPELLANNLLPVAGGSNLQLQPGPAPCGGNVNENSDSIQTIRSVGPEGSVYISETKAQDLRRETRNLSSFLASELLPRVTTVANVKVSDLKTAVDELTTTVVNVCEMFDNIQKKVASLISPDGQSSSLESSVEDEETKGKRRAFINTYRPEDVPARSIEPTSHGTRAEALYMNTPEGVAVSADRTNRDVVSVDKPANAACQNKSMSASREHPMRGDTRGACSQPPRDNSHGACLKLPINYTREHTVHPPGGACYSIVIKDNDANGKDVKDEGGEYELLKNSFSNPIYPKGCPKKTPSQEQSVTQSDKVTSQQKKHMPGATSTWSMLYQEKKHAKPNDRECLSEAFRTNIVDIVENVVFQESELPDWLITDGCITEDESHHIRHFSYRKDQIRALLSAIRGRDYLILTNFLGRIEQANPDIASKIRTSFEANKKENVRPMSCPVCNLVDVVNIRCVCDSLFSVHAIDDCLYNEIIFDTKPAGAQGALWNRVIVSINNLPRKNHREIAMKTLRQALETKGYTYISKKIVKVTNDGPIFPTCSCTIKLGVRGSDPVDYFSPRDSVSTSHDSREVLSLTECEHSIPSMERLTGKRKTKSLESLVEGDIILEAENENGQTEKNSRPTPKPRHRKPDIRSFEDVSVV